MASARMARRLEPAVQEIRRHRRLIVIAHRRTLEPLPSARLETVFLHQADHAFATDVLLLLDQILVNAGAAVPLPALVERGAHEDAQTSIGLRVNGLRSIPRRVEATGRDLQALTERGDRELGLLRVDPGEHYAWFLAKKAAALFRMSRSIRSSRFSLRRPASSARSSVVSPVRPFVRSACACRTLSVASFDTLGGASRLRLASSY